MQNILYFIYTNIFNIIYFGVYIIYFMQYITYVILYLYYTYIKYIIYNKTWRIQFCCLFAHDFRTVYFALGRDLSWESLWESLFSSWLSQFLHLRPREHCGS